MNAVYEEVLRRLREERVRLGYTQREMSSRIRMGQSGYNKAETGLRRFSYYEIKCLCESELDVFYIFTGYRCSAEIRDSLMQFEFSQLTGLLGLLASAAVLGGGRKEVRRGRRLLLYAGLLAAAGEESRSDANMFLCLRRMSGFSQREMAERLGVDVKKLRELENGRCLPDSELLVRLYDEFEVSPAIVLKDKRYLAGEVSRFLEKCESEAADRAIRLLEKYSALMKS